MKRLLLLVPMVLTPLNAEASFQSGNELLDQLQDCDRGEFIQCAHAHAYITGSAETLASEEILDLSCVPSGVTRSQIIKIVTKWLRDNPEQLHIMAPRLIREAVGETWDCAY